MRHVWGSPTRASLRRRSPLGAGPVAQWESVRFTRGRSLVRSQPGPPFTRQRRGVFIALSIIVRTIHGLSVARAWFGQEACVDGHARQNRRAPNPVRPRAIGPITAMPKAGSQRVAAQHRRKRPNSATVCAAVAKPWLPGRRSRLPLWLLARHTRRRGLGPRSPGASSSRVT
jgi:hypothetical protein